MIGFHTPELPPPIGLDLCKVRGGGAFPSQFYGETADGREVYIRYRGGRFSIEIDGERVLEADIGPHLDGEISLSQVCRHFGVNGEIQGETDPEADRNTDFSGQTTGLRGSIWPAVLSGAM